jgi:hypothetical protein
MRNSAGFHTGDLPQSNFCQQWLVVPQSISPCDRLVDLLASSLTETTSHTSGSRHDRRVLLRRGRAALNPSRHGDSSPGQGSCHGSSEAKLWALAKHRRRNGDLVGRETDAGMVSPLSTSVTAWAANLDSSRTGYQQALRIGANFPQEIKQPSRLLSTGVCCQLSL